MGYRAWYRRGVIVVGSLVASFAAGGTVRSQSPQNVTIAASPRALEIAPDRGAAALWQSLQKLHTRASLIMFTAHPDDEDGGMLTYESRGQGVRAALLTLNRGEGGQNVMSDDYWDALGLVRTEELLAADSYYGVQQYWTRVADYGFSKTREEALKLWDHDRVLYDAVRVVRLTRPLVVTSVFVGWHTDGHGNHMVAGQMAQEVYKAAGDPNVFPDQIKEGLRPWTPLKMYSRVPFRVADDSIFDYADGHTYPLEFRNYIEGRTEPGKLATNLVIHTGDYDPLLGYSYSQLARAGLGHQKSQNGGINIPAPGPADSQYHRWASRVPVKDQESSFFDGVDTSLAGISDLAPKDDGGFLKKGLGEINDQVELGIMNFSPIHTEKTAPFLAAGLKATNMLIEQVNASRLSDKEKYDVTFELRVKQAQFNYAIIQALGFSLQATVAPEHRPSGPFAAFLGAPDTFQTAIPGQHFEVDVHAVNQSPVPLDLQKVFLKGTDGENWAFQPINKLSPTLAAKQSVDLHFKVSVPENAAATRPYFHRPNSEQPYYDIDDPRYLNQPTSPYPLSAWAEFGYEGVPVHIGSDVQTVKRVTGLGQVLNPLVVAPAISVSISPRAGIVPLDAQTFSLAVTVHSNVKGPAQGSVRLDLPAGWESAPQTIFFSTAKEGEEQSAAFQVKPRSLQPKPYTVSSVVTYDGHEYREGYHTVGYNGLLPYNLYRPAAYNTTGTEVTVPGGLKVGYIMGTGDEVPSTLEMLGDSRQFPQRAGHHVR